MDHCYLGTQSRFGYEQPCTIAYRDRLTHLYAIGRTGTGKSTLLWNLALQEIELGHGVGLIDPHGDLAERLLDHIPRWRTNHVLYLDAADTEYPIGCNPFSNVPPSQRAHVAADLVAALRQLFEHSWGDRLDWLLLNAALALLDYPAQPGTSMLGIPRLFTDAKYRARVLPKIHNPTARAFWTGEFKGYEKNPRFLSEITAPVHNKVGQFLAHPLMRNIIGQAHQRFDFRHLMDNRRIVIVNLAKGKIGEKNANLLGSLMVSGFAQAALSRANLPEEERVPFGLYVDEFQNFTTAAFAGLLSEVRKYGLALTVANQFLDQLTEPVRAAILGNIGTIVSFRIGMTDAAILAREFHPISAEALASLPPYTAYVKAAEPESIPEARRLGAAPPLSNFNGRKEEIIAHSRQRYARPQAAVEAQLEAWMRIDEPT